MKYALLFLLHACFFFSANAQPAPVNVSEKSIIRDPDGTVYSYKMWKMLEMKGGYILQPVLKENQTEFLLVKKSATQQDQQFENMPKPEKSRNFHNGMSFGTIKFTDINNQTIDLKADKGKIIVINYWFINCPPCRMEIPSLNELVDLYQNNDRVKFIGIALDYRAELQEFLKTFPFRYRIVDNGRDLAARNNIHSFPTHVIIDPKGKVYFHTTGLAPNTVYWLKKSIQELLDQSTAVQQ